RDPVVADRRHRICAAAAAAIIVDAEEREGQRDQRENELNDVLMFVDKVVHGRFDATGRMLKGGQLGKKGQNVTKKGRTQFAPLKSPLVFLSWLFLAEWTGLEPATPGGTGRTNYYFYSLISTLLAASSIDFVQSCPLLSVHVA